MDDKTHEREMLAAIQEKIDSGTELNHAEVAFLHADADPELDVSNDGNS